MALELLLVQSVDLAEYKIDMQEAFRLGAMDGLDIQESTKIYRTLAS